MAKSVSIALFIVVLASLAALSHNQRRPSGGPLPGTTRASGRLRPSRPPKPPPPPDPRLEALRDRIRMIINANSSRSGRVRLDLVSESFIGVNLRLKCVANVTTLVKFVWRFKNQTLNDNERIKIDTLAQESNITIRKAQRSDAGQYKCIARWNSSLVAVSYIIAVRPSLHLRIKPKNALVFPASTFVLRCENADGNLTNATYSWFRRLLPHGKWVNVSVNNEVYSWKIPSLSSPHVAADVYDVICEVTSDGKHARGPHSRITVIEKGSQAKLGSCPAVVFEGIQWQETLAGTTDTQPCSSSDLDAGYAKRLCEIFPGRPPKWLRPSLRQCSSSEFTALSDKLDAFSEGFNVNLDIPSLLKQLRSLTRVQPRPPSGSSRPARIFGRDLLDTIDILRRTRKFIRSGEVPTSAEKSFTFFTEVASNVLDLDNQDTWDDIKESNPGTPAELVTALDAFGFDLENDLGAEGDVLQQRREKNLAFEMRRVAMDSEKRKGDIIFQQNNSFIRIPQSIFSESSQSANVTLVSVIYDTLSVILGEVNTTLNLTRTGNSSSYPALLASSKIISSTLKPQGTTPFKQPIKIVLENNASLQAYNKTVQRRCVFWEPEKGDSEWSGEGCRLVPEETTEHITTCECSHLTLFAVLVSSGSESSVTSSELAKLEIISTVGSAISLAAVVLTLIVYACFWRSLKSVRFVNLVNLCLALAMLDIFSVLRGPFKNEQDACAAIGILLHFFLLALFMWMMCEGILLYLLLTNVFKSDYGKRWYIFVHALGWGVPAVIVAITAGVRGASWYGLPGKCWLGTSGGFIWAAMTPLILVLLASYVVYGVMIHRVLTTQKVQQEDAVGKFRATARASIIIMPVLGFTWEFAILDFFFDKLALKYLFAISNSLQGLFIFLFHCVFNKQVQQAVFKQRKPERRSILDKIKTQEMRLKESQESLDSIK